MTTSPKKFSQSGWSAKLLPQAKDKPDPVAVKIVVALAGLENDPKFNLGNQGYTLSKAGLENDPQFNLGNQGYTLRRAKGKGAGFIAYKNEKAK